MSVKVYSKSTCDGKQPGENESNGLKNSEHGTKRHSTCSPTGKIGGFAEVATFFMGKGGAGSGALLVSFASDCLGTAAG